MRHSGFGAAKRRLADMPTALPSEAKHDAVLGSPETILDRAIEAFACSKEFAEKLPNTYGALLKAIVDAPATRRRARTAWPSPRPTSSTSWCR